MTTREKIKLYKDWIMGIYLEPPNTYLTGLYSLAKFLYWMLALKKVTRYFVGTFHGLLFLFDTRNDGAGRAYILPDLEYGLTVLMRTWLKKGSIFIDGGANVGTVTLYAAAQGASVHSFEPTPDTWRMLAANTYLNGLEEWVFPNKLAISSSHHYLPFFVAIDEYSCINSFKLSPITQGKQKKIVVECVTLDSYCKEHKIDKIDILKLDIEGYELDALRGAKKLLESGKVDIIYWESSDVATKEVRKKTAKHLEKFGFTNFGIDYKRNEFPLWTDADHDCISVHKRVMKRFQNIVRFP